MILLKSESRSSLEVATLLKTNQISVNKWLKRYEQEGIKGLNTKTGQGRKPILDGSKDEQKVRQAIVNERQRLKYAKHQLEESLDKQFSLKTLKRFLKNLSADGSEFV